MDFWEAAELEEELGQVFADGSYQALASPPEAILWRYCIVQATGVLAEPEYLARVLRVDPEELRAAERRYFCSEIFEQHAHWAGVDPDRYREILHRSGLLYGHDLRSFSFRFTVGRHVYSIVADP